MSTLPELANLIKSYVNIGCTNGEPASQEVRDIYHVLNLNNNAKNDFKKLVKNQEHIGLKLVKQSKNTPAYLIVQTTLLSAYLETLESNKRNFRSEEPDDKNLNPSSNSDERERKRAKTEFKESYVRYYFYKHTMHNLELILKQIQELFTCIENTRKIVRITILIT